MYTLLNRTYQSRPISQEAAAAASQRVDNLVKPVGSLGELETLAIRLAGIYHRIDPRINSKAMLVFASDHGVVEEQIASAPQVVTEIQAINIAKGRSGVGALAGAANTRVYTVDLGINSEHKHDLLIDRRIARGTCNMAREAAMTREQAEQSLVTGIEMAQRAVADGANLLGVGEMGIGNTTPTTALLSVMTGRSPAELVGIGANFPVDRLPHKAAVIERAIAVNRPDAADPIDLLSKIGGFEIGGMAGVILGAALEGVPVVIDGYISTLSALLAVMIDPTCKDYIIASHASKEKGAQLASELLGVKPYLHLDMRLGEGSGSVLAMQLCEAACTMINDMITFAESGIGSV